MTTFAKQADIYLLEIATRNQNRAKDSSIAAFKSRINAALPTLGKIKLDDIRSGALKTLAGNLVREKYSPNSVQSILTIVKMVVASDVDADGDPKHLRKWNNRFIDAPPIDFEEVRVPTPEEIQSA